MEAGRGLDRGGGDPIDGDDRGCDELNKQQPESYFVVQNIV